MSPIMQTICDELRAYGLDRYIDGFGRDSYATELPGSTARCPPPCRSPASRSFSSTS